MAVDMFLKLDGIKGEAQDSTHKDDIDILSFSWGATQQGTHGTGGGGGTGKVNVHDITIHKYVDSSSCDLMLHCCNGKHIPTALITVRKAGESPVEYLKIKLTDVLVSSVQSGHHAGGGDRVQETISLNFGKFNEDYLKQDSTGAGSPAGNIGWDVKANKKL